MPVKRQIAPRTIEATDLMSGRVEPLYIRTLIRLLSAHALAEKLTFMGYERALESVREPELREVCEKNRVEERKHARLLYRVLEEIGTSEKQADRSMVPALKAPSFVAPLYFAHEARGDLDLRMASLSLDVTGLLMIGINYKDSSYSPHARAAELILEEEAEHEVFANEELGQAAAKFGKKKVNAALRQWLPRAANFFGPPGSGFTFDCLRFGLKARDNQELTELYLTMLERRVEQVGLSMPRLTRDYPYRTA